MLNLPISRDGFLWAFSITSQIHHVPLAATLILQKHQAPFTLGSFRVAAEQAGFRVRQKAVPNSQLAKLPVPCLVTLIPADLAPAADKGITVPNAIREYQLALLERIDEKSVVLAEACSKSSLTMSREIFEKRFAGEALIIAPPMSGAHGARDNKNSQQTNNKKTDGKLGPAWFVPQLEWLRAMLRIAR